MSYLRWFFCVAAFCLTATTVGAADRIRIAAQKTGTLAWELDVIRARGLDRAAGLDLEITEHASPEAGKIALKAGAVDMIVADIVWVARERALGGTMLFYPFSSAVGAVMAPPTSAVRAMTDLRHRKLGVAGGAIDKSWLLLQAWARQHGMELAEQTQIVYGAPSLLAAKAVQGELDAVLEYWNISAELEAQGLRRVIEMADVERDLGARGKVSMLGFAFSDAFARNNGPALQRYFDIAMRARTLLANEPALWLSLAKRMRFSTDALSATLRQRYAEALAPRPLDEDEADARILMRTLAASGGAEYAAAERAMQAGIYWRPGRGG